MDNSEARPPRVADRVSIVIPTRNSSRTIATAINSARGQIGADVEVIVVDRDSDDGTERIAAQLGATVVRGGPERSAQRNRGLAVSTGEHVLFLDSDMELEPDVARQAVAAFNHDAAVGALIIPELSRGEGFWAQCRVLEKQLYLGDASAEAARAYRARLIEQIGGFDTSIVAAEDYELHDRVLANGHAIGRVRAHVWHDEGRLRLAAVFRKKRYYGQWLPRWAALAPRRSRLRRSSLVRHPQQLLAHPVRSAGLIVLKLTDAAGLAFGAATSTVRA